MRRALFAALLLLLLPHPAQADLKLCNRTSYILYAATATLTGHQRLTQGWTRLIPGDCAATVKGILGGQYLVYARTSLAHGGAARAWGGSVPVCVKDADFRLQQPEPGYSCAADSFPLPFAPVDRHGHGDWTLYLDDSPALASLTAAQLAGAKRLLADNGYKIGAIDGQPGKPTGAALADFRKKMRFKPQDGNDILFATLEKQAARTSAPQGYALCNDTAQPVLAATAQADPPASQGWWRVAPHACARLLTAPLAGRPVYLLVQTLTGAVLAGGDALFCVTPAAFQVQKRDGCAARGMTEAGFASTAGQGRAGYVAHVDGKGLVR